jgi:hypothetical protein
MKQKFRDIHLSKDNLKKLQIINEIIQKYQGDGYVLTLRQLYYQLVSTDIIPNNVKEYGKVSKLLKEGRMAGIVDWEAIEDRLRKPSQPGSWDSPKSIMNSVIYAYRKNRLQGQKNYLEVWVEKDALSGVLKRVTEQYGIPIVVNRGYSSVTAIFDAHERFEKAKINGQIIKVIYIGDFDPSGQDMIRDISDRINEFNVNQIDPNLDSYEFNILPIALTWKQIKQYNPPPNSAKITDPRAKSYIEKHGPTSWEVDALPPEVLNNLLNNAILENIDEYAYKNILANEESDKIKLINLKSKL